MNSGSYRDSRRSQPPGNAGYQPLDPCPDSRPACGSTSPSQSSNRQRHGRHAFYFDAGARLKSGRLSSRTERGLKSGPLRPTGQRCRSAPSSTCEQEERGHDRDAVRAGRADGQPSRRWCSPPASGVCGLGAAERGGEQHAVARIQCCSPHSRRPAGASSCRRRGAAPVDGSVSRLRSRDVGPDDLAAPRKRARPELRPQLLKHR